MIHAKDDYIHLIHFNLWEAKNIINTYKNTQHIRYNLS